MFDFFNTENIGKDYKGFYLIAIDDIPDYKAKGLYLRHKNTGLEVYHVVKNDKENLFAFAFRTLAKDSKGTAHIMEHSTLCGSEKFPLKEPFATLASTSLNTYLNAFTYPDKTVYPGASVIRDDYFTMMDVYADSVFFPILDHATFLQEGHRLELDKEDNVNIQGVVYNEMKGDLSSFQSVALSNLVNSMFPESYPSFESGGDPLEIPNLTYEEFLDFHQRFYNPDNCLLFLYGDIPTSDQLDFIDEKYISRIEKKYGIKDDNFDYTSKLPLVKTEIKELQKLTKIKESKEIRLIGPETGANGSLVSMNWYSGTSDMEKYYLSEVLFGNDSSPISYALKESGLGDNTNCGNFGQFYEEFFTIGLIGVKKGNEQKLFDLINSEIKKVYEEGISQEDIDSAIMGIDFTLREVSRAWGPQALTVMEKVLKGWQNGLPCNKNLSPFKSFEVVKQNIKNDPDFTRKLIKKYFIDQKVTVKTIVEPSKKYFSERKKKEEELIKKLEKNLDKKALKKNLDELHTYQNHIETPEETKCIPTTKLSSLNPNIDFAKTDLRFIKKDNYEVPLFINKEDTNGLFYIDVYFPFDHINPKYYKYIPLLSDLITNLGWNNKNWDDCITESSCVMGDIWGKICTGQIPDEEHYQKAVNDLKIRNIAGRYWIGLSCKGLTSKAHESLEMLEEIITTMSFSDEKRFAVLAQENYTDLKSSIISSGRDLASKRARAADSAGLALNEIMYGVTQLWAAKEITEKPVKEMLEILKNIYFEALNGGGIIHITADEDSLNEIIPEFNEFVVKADIKKLITVVNHSVEEFLPYIVQSELLEGDKTQQVISVESQTGYAVAVSKASKVMSKEAAAETILTTWLGGHSLWNKIRTTGGAYGANSWSDSTYQQLVMTSYRDPNPEKSVQVFIEALKEIVENPISNDDIEKTIVSCYGDAIVPQAPQDKGLRAFEIMLFGSNPEIRQKRMNNIMHVTSEDVSAAAKRLYENTKKYYKNVIFCSTDKNFTSKIVKLPL